MSVSNRQHLAALDTLRAIIRRQETELHVLRPVGPRPPACPQHEPRQHRDDNPPWCGYCGWTDPIPYQPPRKIR